MVMKVFLCKYILVYESVASLRHKSKVLGQELEIIPVIHCSNSHYSTKCDSEQCRYQETWLKSEIEAEKLPPRESKGPECCSLSSSSGYLEMNLGFLPLLFPWGLSYTLFWPNQPSKLLLFESLAETSTFPSRAWKEGCLEFYLHLSFNLHSLPCQVALKVEKSHERDYFIERNGSRKITLVNIYFRDEAGMGQVTFVDSLNANFEYFHHISGEATSFSSICCSCEILPVSTE